MNSHNTKPSFAFHKTPAASKDDKDDGNVIRRSLEAPDLAIADDADNFCDPYNSTGKHVILKAKLTRRD